MSTSILLRCLVLTIFIQYTFGSFPIVKTISDSVLFETSCETMQNKNWKFQNGYLFFNKVPLKSPIKHTILLNNNGSLYIDSVSLVHEGIYQCICDEINIRNYSLRIEGG